MRYNELGHTGMSVSALGFGGSALHAHGETDAAAHAAVRRAIDEGINYVDTSPLYGNSEAVLGHALKGRRDEVVLATKCGAYPGPQYDHSRTRIRRSLEESLRRLRTDRIDLFQLHDIEFSRREQIIAESVPEMQALKREGKVRAIGITGYPLRNLRAVAEAREVDVVLSYCHYTLLNTRMDAVLKTFCRERGIGLINAAPLHMGLLCERKPPSWTPTTPALLATVARAALRCREAGTNLATLAVRFSLQHPTVATTLIGMASVAEVEDDLRAADAPPDADLVREVQEILAGFCDYAWPCGREENQD